MENPIEILRSLVANKTQAQVAEDLGVSPQYLSDVMKARRSPGKKLLDGMGIEKIVSYRRLKRARK